jgi:hypothetical protein
MESAYWYNNAKQSFTLFIELSNTTFLGAQYNALGFNYLTTIGAGFELDSSNDPVFITRTRLLYRYTFGKDVSGFAIGLAMSF